ncbi:MAG TPA: NAD(P)H-dependent glycerol-3-phosphate dehydrogenase [Fimbriimonadaceae bacterium]|nr:NAD(P)H-dependent glycerol-3-phosphate dehydrogenase [Fimbriimonadaceae bacterium]
MQVSVVGAGAWGTALAILLARNGHEIKLLAHTDEEVEMLASHRENLRYLPGFALPEEVSFGLAGAGVVKTDMVVMAVPSGAVRESAHYLADGSDLIVIASKGLEASTGKPLTEVVLDVHPQAQVGAISGPNLAVEIVRGVPTAAVTAFPSEADAEIVRQAFKCRTFRVYITDDVIGIQIAGALKNCVAIAAGISDGLGFGDNTKGALIARGLREMTLLGVARGARPETFTGIAGVGDLFATASSELSRNYRVGRALGEGGVLATILENLGQVAEGVPTTYAAMVLAKELDVKTPVFDAIRDVLDERMRPIEGVALLMERETPQEGLVTSLRDP